MLIQINNSKFHSPRIKYKINLIEEENIKISRSPIVNASLNQITNILGFCTGSSEVVLTNIISKEKQFVTSTIQIGIEYINKILWLNSYQFVVGGSGGLFKIFSIMNLKEDSFEIHTSGITTMKRTDESILTGSSDGTISIFDTRTQTCNIKLSHTVKSKLQPIKDLSTENNYLYSSTIFNGRVWLWDIRAPKKPVNIKENRKCQNTLNYFDGSLYALNSENLMRVSSTLELNEILFTFNNQEEHTNGMIKYFERFDSLFFSSKGTLSLMNNSFYHFDIPGISGFEFFRNEKILSYGTEGKISILKMDKEINVEE